MSTIDLIILGLLLEKPMNAYELACLITEKQVGRLLKISTPAVYKSCKRLSDAGLLSRTTTQKTDLPEKALYSVNKKGKLRFSKLMEHFSSNITPFFLDFNAFLWNIEKVEKERGLEMLNTLHEELSNLKKWIIRHEKDDCGNAPFAVKAIVKQYRMTISTLLKWSEETIRDYKQIKEME